MCYTLLTVDQDRLEKCDEQPDIDHRPTRRDQGAAGRSQGPREALRAVLIEQGPGAYEGELFRATVSESERATLDMAAVRAKLSRQFIQANTTVTPVVTVRVAARSNVRLAA
jgi:hypothetical protein